MNFSIPPYLAAPHKNHLLIPAKVRSTLNLAAPEQK